MKYTLIYLSLAIYCIYMLNWFKTTWNFAHPLTKFSSDYLAHPVNTLDIPIGRNPSGIDIPIGRNPSGIDIAVNPVCKLGNILSWVLAIGLIIRGLSLDSYITKINRLYIIFLVITFVLSLLNFNVTIYLVPLLIFELYILIQTSRSIQLTNK